MRRLLPTLLLVGGLLMSGARSHAADSDEDTAMKVLGRHCIGCHGHEKQRGELRLSTRQDALKGGERGPAIVPGDPKNSRLLQLIETDGDPHMPPKNQLDRKEIAALTNWVRSGARWKPEQLTSRDMELVVQTNPPPDSWQPVLTLAISPDNRWIAFGRGPDLEVHDLHGENLPLHSRSQGDRTSVRSLVWSGDGQRLYSGGFERILVWDREAGMIVQELTGFHGDATAMAVTPDNKMLVIASGFPGQPGTLHLRPIHGEAAGSPRSWEAHKDSIYALAFSDEGRSLVSAGADGLIKVWKVSDGSELRRLEGHSSHVLALAVSPNSTLLASAGADQDVKIWDSQTWEVIQTVQEHPGNVTGISWISDSEPRLISICEDGAPRRCRTDAKRPERTLAKAPDVLHTAAVASDSSTLYAGCNDGRVYVWDKDGRMIGTLEPSGLAKR